MRTEHLLSRVVRKSVFAYAKTKTQISCALTAQLVFAKIYYYPSTSYIRNCKPLAILCGCAARFVSDLVRNPDDRVFS